MGDSVGGGVVGWWVVSLKPGWEVVGGWDGSPSWNTKLN